MEKIYFGPQSEGKLQHRGEPHQRKGLKQLVTSHRICSLEAQRDAACFHLLIKSVMSVLRNEWCGHLSANVQTPSKTYTKVCPGDSRPHPIEDQF